MTSAATASTPVAFTAIPVISLARWTSAAGDPGARLAFADELCRVCHEVGFLLLSDHGVEQRFLDDYFAALEQFFTLPEEVKGSIDKVQSPHFRGWERVGSELTDNRIDHREQLDLSTEHPPRPSDTMPAYLRLDGPNQWPSEEAAPDLRRLVESFFEQMGRIADELMAAMGLGLGLGETHFKELFGERPFSFVKLINYPPTPDGEAGVNAHHDAGFITVLAQHQQGGLQALNPDGNWIDVPPTPGTLVINLGEMLQSMTGNFFVATTHRVITSRARVSSGYFHGPDLRTSLAPLELDRSFTDAVAASPRHASAGFMAKRDELLAGRNGTGSTSASTYGEQLWNYYQRSYPALMARHHADHTGPA